MFFKINAIFKIIVKILTQLKYFSYYYFMPMLHFYTSGFLEFSESIGMEHSEAVVRRCSVNKVFLKISENSQENTCTRVSFLNFIQLTLAQVFSFKFCEIFKNTFFTYNTSGDCF